MAGVAGMGTPNSLKRPVPNQDPGIDLSNVAQVPDIASMPMPAAQPAAAAPSPMDDMEADFNSMAGINPMDDMEADFSAMMDGEEPDVRGEGNIMDGSLFDSLKQQLEQAPTRFLSSFARSDWEKKQVLDKAYGEDNVRKNGDEFEFRKPGSKKWQQFDSENLEIVGDTIDLARDAVEETVASATTLGLFAPAATAEVAAAPPTLGASLLALPATFVGSRMAGGVAGVAAGDAAQEALGIPHDPERSFLKEAGTSALFSAAGGKIGKWMGDKIAERGARQTSKMALLSDEMLKKETQDVVEASEQLKQSGLIENVPGYDSTLLPTQVAPSNRKAKDLGKGVASDDKVQNYLQVQGQMISDAFSTLFNRTANYSKRVAENIGEKLGSKVDNLTEAEGQIIGELRDKAIRIAEGKSKEMGQVAPKFGMQQTVETLKELNSQLGIRRVGDKLKFPKTTDELQEVVNRGFAKDLNEARTLVSTIKGYSERMFNSPDGLSMSEMDVVRKQLQGISNNLWDQTGKMDKPSQRTLMVTKLKDSVRDDQIENMGKVFVDEADNAAYAAAKERFSVLKDSAATLKNVLKNDQISSNALASNLFSKGPDSLSRIRAAKAILLRDSPELWEDIVGQHLKGVVFKNSELATDGVSKTNWTAVSKQILGLGDEVVAEMFPGAAKKDLDNLIKYAANAEVGRNILKDPLDPKQLGLIKNMVLSFQSVFAAASAGASIFEMFDKNKRVLRFLNDNGVEAFTRGIPANKKGQVAKMLSQYMDRANNEIKSKGIDLGATAGRQLEREINYKEEE